MELRELLCSLETIDRCGEKRKNSLSLTKKQADDAYRKMKMILKYVFDFEYDSDYIPNRVDSMPKSIQKKMYRTEYNVYQKLKKLIFADQKKCTFLYYYILILTLEDYSEVSSLIEETHRLFRSIESNPPKYNRKMVDCRNYILAIPHNKHEMICRYFRNAVIPKSISPKARETILLLKAAAEKHKMEEDWQAIFSKYRPWEEFVTQSESLGDYTQTFVRLIETYDVIRDELWCDYFVAQYGVKPRFASFNDAEVEFIQQLYLLNRTEKRCNRIYNIDSKDGKKHHQNPNHRNWSKLTRKERNQLADMLFNLYDDDKTYLKYIPHVYEEDAETSFFLLLSDIVGDDRYKVYVQAKFIFNTCALVNNNIDKIDSEQYLVLKNKVSALHRLCTQLDRKVCTQQDIEK